MKIQMRKTIGIIRRDAEIAALKAERDQAISMLKEWNLAGYFPSHDEWKAWETEFGGRVREFLSARAALGENK